MWDQSTSPDTTQVQVLSNAPYVLVGAITQAEGKGVSLSPPSLAQEESQWDDSRNKAAFLLPWMESGTQRPVQVFCLSVRLVQARWVYVSPSWLQQRSLPASAREGTSESRARERARRGADDEDRHSAKFLCYPLGFLY